MNGNTGSVGVVCRDPISNKNKKRKLLSFPFPSPPLPTPLSCYKCPLNTWDFQKSMSWSHYPLHSEVRPLLVYSATAQR